MDNDEKKGYNHDRATKIATGIANSFKIAVSGAAISLSIKALLYGALCTPNTLSDFNSFIWNKNSEKISVDFLKLGTGYCLSILMREIGKGYASPDSFGFDRKFGKSLQALSPFSLVFCVAVLMSTVSDSKKIIQQDVFPRMVGDRSHQGESTLSRQEAVNRWRMNLSRALDQKIQTKQPTPYNERFSKEIANHMNYSTNPYRSQKPHSWQGP